LVGQYAAFLKEHRKRSAKLHKFSIQPRNILLFLSLYIIYKEMAIQYPLFTLLLYLYTLLLVNGFTLQQENKSS